MLIFLVADSVGAQGLQGFSCDFILDWPFYQLILITIINYFNIYILLI